MTKSQTCLILVALGLAVAGCTPEPSTVEKPPPPPTVTIGDKIAVSGGGWGRPCVQELQFSNHVYLLISFSGEGGGAITHAEHCQCRSKLAVRRDLLTNYFTGGSWAVPNSSGDWLTIIGDIQHQADKLKK